MARILEVFLNEQSVGRLKQDDSGSLWFSYNDEWLGSDSAMPLSVSLPLRTQPFSRNECRPFFAGLLPEEASRSLIAKAFGVSDKNDFALLEKIGGECAGAVSLIPPGERPMDGMASYREISTAELADKILDLPKHPLLAGQEGIRLSLAGAQGKLAVAIRDGKFFLPLNGSPSTHILKPQGAHFEGLVENEFFCMRLAASAGLEAATVAIGTAGKERFLQVERYDRKVLLGGDLKRVHQEDFCQALGIPPELKYQQEGGPNLKKCFAILRSVSSVPGPDVLRLFDAVVFNYLIGNNDAHGKNFSFLFDSRRATLAPLYDLVCTQAYEGVAAEMAMKIGDERNPQRIFTKNWRKFFDASALGQAQATKRLKSLAGKVQALVEGMDSTSPGWKMCSPWVIANCGNLLNLGWDEK